MNDQKLRKGKRIIQVKRQQPVENHSKFEPVTHTDIPRLPREYAPRDTQKSRPLLIAATVVSLLVLLLPHEGAEWFTCHVTYKFVVREIRFS